MTAWRPLRVSLHTPGCFVVDADGSNLTQLTSTQLGVDCANGGGCAGGPAWSPDGQTIAFQRQTGPLIGNEWRETAIYTIGADGAGLTPSDAAEGCRHRG